MYAPEQSDRDSTAKTAFAAQQYGLSYAPGVENHFWHIARNRIIRRHLVQALESQGAPGGAVLDVGCGPGIAVGFMRGSGIDCYGVELGAPQVRPGMEAFVRTATDATRLPAELRARVRVITLLDVLEHIEHPAAFLKTLMEAFPNAGAILVAVPARQELWSNYDEFFGHFLRYDKGSMLAVAEAAGLEPVVMKYFFNALYPVMYALTLRSRTRSLQTPPQAGLLRRIAHTILGGAFLLEERLPFLGDVPGTSLLAVLKRRA